MTDFTFAHREEGFDNHIDMSIRGYSELHDDIVSMSRYFAETGTYVIDLGCSTGKTLAAMIEQNRKNIPDVQYIGFEIAEGFEDDMKKREAQYPDELQLMNKDIRNVDFVNCSLVTSLFTLQFMPMKDRRSVINNIWKGLNKGGAFVFAEKIYSTDAKIQDMLTFMYYDFKRQNFTAEDILDKERTLRSMLKPNTWVDIHSMLVSAGFSHIQPFWQNHLFIGCIAIK